MLIFYLKLTYFITYELISYPFLRWFNCMNYNGNQRLDGKVAVVTGSNTGIGKAAAHCLAKRGAKVILACRDLDKGNLAVDEIKSQVTDANLILMKLDLASNKSVEQFAEKLLREEKQVDILVNNAGLFFPKFMLTEDNYELHFGVNFLSHFYLTLLLLERLKASENPKIVNVSALGHRLTHIHFDDINLTKNFSHLIAYAQAKLAQVMFTRELAIRCPSVKTYSLHPGIVDTDIPRYVSNVNDAPSFFSRIFKTKLTKNAMEGAQTIIYCLLDEKADKESGLYYQDQQIATSSSYASSGELRKHLWDLSLEMLKVPQDSVLRTY